MPSSWMPHRTRTHALRCGIVVLGLVACGACAPRTTRVQAAPHPSPSASSVRTLRADIGRVLSDPAFARMQWAVVVREVATGETLFAENPSRLVMPASNMKIVTLAAAAERLGWEFTYETRLASSGTLAAGTLRGDLVVIGTGDPTIGRRGGRPTRVFEAWADDLRARGITRIEGRVVADARAFDDRGLGAGWAWDYLAYGYAAPTSALQFDENTAEVVIRPGPAPGSPALVEVRPTESGLIVDNRVDTEAGGEANLDLLRLPGSDRLVVTGRVPSGSPAIVRVATVERPALYFVRMLRRTLLERGIEVTGGAIESDAATDPPRADLQAILVHQSPPLAEIAKTMMKVSQNLYAETLVKTLGTQAGTGTADAGLQVIRDVLREWGIEPDQYVLTDGSGLSRYNYLCADLIVAVLRRMHADARHREAFLAALPVGGQDGTLARRFQDSPASGHVRAKTGSIANVRALSGYVTTRDGELLAFSMVANHFTGPQATIDAAADAIVERLVAFSRR